MANNVCDGMTAMELRDKIDSNDRKFIRNLTTFSSMLSGSRGFWRQRTKELIAFGRSLEILSGGKDRLNVFLTFRYKSLYNFSIIISRLTSFPDAHMEELHRLLPGSEAYIGKTVVKREEDIPDGADENDFILEKDDYNRRKEAIHSNGHIVSKFASIRLEKFLKTILVNTLGITDYSIRTEFQSRTALHWHMIGNN